MGLWNPRKPLTQPPGFRRIGHQGDQPAKADAPGRDARRALHAAQFARELAAQRVGGRRAVVCE